MSAAKALVAWAIVSLFAFLPSAATAQSVQTKYAVNVTLDDPLNVRTEPLGKTILVSLQRDAIVSATGNHKNIDGAFWLEIDYGPIRGWVNKRFLRETTEAVSKPPTVDPNVETFTVRYTLDWTLQTLNPSLLESRGFTHPVGVVVRAFDGDNPKLTKLNEGDIIISINGIQIPDGFAFLAMLDALSAGQPVRLRLIRGTKEIIVTEPVRDTGGMLVHAMPADIGEVLLFADQALANAVTLAKAGRHEESEAMLLEARSRFQGYRWDNGGRPYSLKDHSIKFAAREGQLARLLALVAASRSDPETAANYANEGQSRIFSILSANRNQPFVRTYNKSLYEFSGVDDGSLGRAVAVGDGGLALVGDPPINISAKHLSDGDIIIVPLIGDGSDFVIVIVKNKDDTGSAAIVHIPDASENLRRLVYGADGRGGWAADYKNQFASRTDHAAATAWTNAITAIGQQLWNMFWKPILEVLPDKPTRNDTRMFILPASDLASLPLGLAMDPRTNTRLIDRYVIATIPNLNVLALGNAALAADQARVMSVINPTSDLKFTELEGALVQSAFADRHPLVLTGPNATLDAVSNGFKTHTIWHFAGHGFFDVADFRRSGLILSDQQVLSVQHLFDMKALPSPPRMVILSACESGLYERDQDPNAFFGLPNAILALGAGGVLSTQWLVDDLATALLVSRFAELLTKGTPPATALRNAQIWLRDGTAADFIAYVEKRTAQGDFGQTNPSLLVKALEAGGARTKTASRFAAIRAAVDNNQPHTPAHRIKPFDHPYYWGAFVYNGQ
ncbi:CHAT domain-containing protein [Hyphomicrobium sp.]|uniref:CHAT domain-containing protein n=1 Tax=Hyphomicrobium sp. TaxID=82 RepID=UPI0025B8C518|nr:CHAT domain-containing protein [Hyphomicrobium sp.]MCC7251291.1 CHAT domain-containing protein [Hyphomicrobium sp.]